MQRASLWLLALCALALVASAHAAKRSSIRVQQPSDKPVVVAPKDQCASTKQCKASCRASYEGGKMPKWLKKPIMLAEDDSGGAHVACCESGCERRSSVDLATCVRSCENSPWVDSIDERLVQLASPKVPEPKPTPVPDPAPGKTVNPASYPEAPPKPSSPVVPITNSTASDNSTSSSNATAAAGNNATTSSNTTAPAASNSTTSTNATASNTTDNANATAARFHQVYIERATVSAGNADHKGRSHHAKRARLHQQAQEATKNRWQSPMRVEIGLDESAHEAQERQQRVLAVHRFLQLSVAQANGTDATVAPAANNNGTASGNSTASVPPTSPAAVLPIPTKVDDSVSIAQKKANLFVFHRSMCILGCRLRCPDINQDEEVPKPDVK